MFVKFGDTAICSGFGAARYQTLYKQTALGVVWVVLAQPLVAAVIFTVVFGRVAKPATAPYLLFVFAG